MAEAVMLVLLGFGALPPLAAAYFALKFLFGRDD